MAIDVRRFDIYRKVPKDLTQPTVTGAVISIGCIVFMSLLFISEFLAFISTKVESELFVDSGNTHTSDKILVRINISLPRLPCSYVGLDIQDDMGRHEVGFVENTEKHPLNNELGCRFEGSFLINKVPGNFHVSTHAANQQPDSIDMAHIIHEVSFGAVMPAHIPGSYNALKEMNKEKVQASESHEYYMKIVPTVYNSLHGEQRESYQYTHAYKTYLGISHRGVAIPAIWFRYDMTPITVKYTEVRQPFYSFLTMICAIIGGTFTVAGILDSLVFTASEFYKKFEIGKLS